MEDIQQLKNKVKSLEHKISEIEAYRNFALETHGIPGSSPPDGAGYGSTTVTAAEPERATAINSVLYAIIKALNSTEDLNGLVNSIYDSLSLIIDTTSIFIAVCDPDEDRMTFPYYRDFDDITFVENVSSSGSITFEVVQSGRPLFLSQADLIERYASTNDVKQPIGEISKVWLGVPLKIQDDVIGALVVQSYSDPTCYTSEDIPLLESVSDYIAVAINRRRKEDALRRSERKYRELFERTSDFIYVHDLKGNFLESNMEFKKITYPDFGPEDLIILNIRDFIPIKLEELYDDYMQRLLEHGQDKGRMTVKAKNGKQEIILEYTNRLIRAPEGTPLCIQGSARDVTVQTLRKREKRELEKQLMQSQKMEAIGTLSSGIAHDFNNILFSILGYAQLGEEVAIGGKARAYFHNIHKGALRARDLIGQLLSFSRPPKESYKPIDISPTIREALRLIRASLPTTVLIHQEITAEIGHINGDPSQIHQVVMNLVTNAFQAIENNKGVIEVFLSERDLTSPLTVTGTMAPGRYVELIVRDTGSGMEKAVQKRIFEPFFTTKAVGKGTGLGLSTVHGIIKRHKGHIRVHSDMGKGTQFQIYFPVISQCSIQKRTKNTAVEYGNERILIVDDEPMLVEMYREVLQDRGYQAEVYTKSSAALNAFQRNPDHYDLLLTDNTMPGMTGVELSSKIKMIRKGIPVVLATGFDGSISDEERNNADIQEIVLKPIAINDLLRVIRKTLDDQ